jgi:transcriptional regulator with XRE-family HTH domain
MTKPNNLDCGPINVAQVIRTARRQTGLTQAQFCAYICASEPTKIRIVRSDLSKYESGRNMPPADKFIKIMRLYKYLSQ